MTELSNPPTGPPPGPGATTGPPPGLPGATVPPATSQPAPPGPETVTAAFATGWLVAQLHGPLPEATPQLTGNGPLGLPSAAQLGRADGVKLATRELDRQLHGPLGPYLRPGITVAGIGAPGDDGYQSRVLSLHLNLLEDLTVVGRPQGAAYSLGTSLASICNEPHSKERFAEAFASQQLAVMQGWLSDIAGSFAPTKTPQVVAQSLDHWSAWLAVDPVQTWTAGTLATVQAAVRHQGEHWRSLLVGATDPAEGLSPAAWVQAGQTALRRAGGVLRGLLARFWVPILMIVAITAGAVLLGIHYGRGTAKVWTSLVSAAAGMGLTGKSIQSGLKRLASSKERPLVDLAEVDAMSWAATWLPNLPVGRVDAYKLRSVDTSPPRRPGRAHPH